MPKARFLQAATIIAAGLVLAPALAAAADSVSILIVDQQRVLAESLAGQDMNVQAKALMAQIQAEVAEEQNAVMAAERDLEQNAKLMSPAQRTEKIKQLEARKQAYPAFEQKKAQTYQMSMNRASNQVAVALKPILQQIIDQRKAQIMLDRQVVMYSVPGLDVTDDAISRLNNVVRTVKVERVDYGPQGQRKGPALPAPAPGKPPIGIAKPK
jgi:outer membrane protein